MKIWKSRNKEKKWAKEKHRKKDEESEWKEKFFPLFHPAIWYWKLQFPNKKFTRALSWRNALLSCFFSSAAFSSGNDLRMVECSGSTTVREKSFEKLLLRGFRFFLHFLFVYLTSLFSSFNTRVVISSKANLFRFFL